MAAYLDLLEIEWEMTSMIYIEKMNSLQYLKKRTSG